VASSSAAVIPFYPEDRDCTAPSASRILEIFNGLARHHLLDNTGYVIGVFEAILTPLQQQILRHAPHPPDRLPEHFMVLLGFVWVAR
jgi:hypothetical protein